MRRRSPSSRTRRRSTPSCPASCVANCLLEEPADLGAQPVEVDRAVRVARHIEAAVFASVLTTVLAPVFAAVLAPLIVVTCRTHRVDERPRDAECRDECGYDASVH